MLKIENLTVGYADLVVLRQINMQIEQGQIVALIGSNGAGKTTALKTISGLLRARGGSVVFEGKRVTAWPSHKIVQAGLIQVPEGRHLFLDMTVLENLELGAYRRGGSDRRETLRRVFEFFPKLEERRGQRVGTLSGGERQMLAIGRGLMLRPQIMLLDEPSLGLSPLLVQEIFAILRRLNTEEHVTMMLVEQNARIALDLADVGYVMEIGRIVMDGSADRLMESEDIKSFYLGHQEEGQRGEKRWKRKKTWR